MERGEVVTAIVERCEGEEVGEWLGEDLLVDPVELFFVLLEVVFGVVLFALPMDFTNAKLAIDMTVNGLKVTRKVALNYKKADGTKEFIKFLPTHKYNFKIRIPDSVVFDVSPEQCDYDVAGGTDQITVTSYAYNSAGEKTPVGWTATRYSIDGKDVEDEDKQWFDFDESVLNPDDYDIRKTMLKGWDVFRFHDVEEHLRLVRAVDHGSFVQSSSGK